MPGIEQCANREERQLVLIVNSRYMKDDVDKYTQVKWYKMNDALWLSEQIEENAPTSTLVKQAISFN